MSFDSMVLPSWVLEVWTWTAFGVDRDGLAHLPEDQREIEAQLVVDLKVDILQGGLLKS